MLKSFLVVLLLALFAVGCAPEGQATPTTPSPTALPPTPSPTATPMSTPSPTLTAAEILEQVQRMLDEAATLDFSLQGDMVAEALALYLSRDDREELNDEELAQEFQGLMEQAGLQAFIGVSIVGIETEPKAYLASFGYYTISLFWGPLGEPLKHQVVSQGDAVNEARLVEDEAGVIFAAIGASTVTPDFLLLRWEEGGWGVVWPGPPYEPAQRSDLWVTADGEVSFAADDFSLIRTEGSSWGAAFMEEDPFFECHACPHRYFEVLWERQGDLYVPQVSPPDDAPYYDRLWEVTQPSPYATLFEFLRRLRAGDEDGAMELAVGPEVIEQAQDLGLDDTSRSFLGDFEPTPESDVFYFSENDDDFLPKHVALFNPPEQEGEHWLLIEIRQIS